MARHDPTMTPWEPETYLQFEQPRTRPGAELLARIPLAERYRNNALPVGTRKRHDLISVSPSVHCGLFTRRIMSSPVVLSPAKD